MNFFGIVCEFNPFHTGHRYLIQQTKHKTGTDGIVCIMSGSMVQRGDIAIYNKWQRAKTAVQNGADLVLELPVCYVLQSAEIFAKGAIDIINKTGCEGFAFAAECDDIDFLNSMASLKANEPPEYSALIKQALKDGLGYPAACQKAAEGILGNLPDKATEPNTTLAVSYIAAAGKINPKLKIHVEKRLGSYHDTELGGEFASASAIRQKILSGCDARGYSLCGDGDIYDINKISSYILGFFRAANSSSLESITGMEDGLANRLVEMSKQCTTYDEFVKACVSKRYTYHRIRRVILCSLMGIKSAPPPTYARVLALNEKGAEIIRQIKKTNEIQVITKLPKNTSDYEMLRYDILSTDIASLCCNKRGSLDYTTSPSVVSAEKKG